MSDDTDKNIIEKIEKYGSEYLRWLMSMMTRQEKIVDSTRKLLKDSNKHTKLLIVIAISVFLGATIGATIPDRPPLQARTVIFVVVGVLWIFLSFLVHYACRLIGGKAKSELSVSLMIQNLAFVYVASNFLTMIIVSLAKMIRPLDNFLDDHFLFTIGPGGILLGLQFLMLLYLVPVTVSKAHGFSGFKWVVAAIFSACFALLFGAPVFALGGC